MSTNSHKRPYRAILLSGALFSLLFLPILTVFAPSSSLAEAEANFAYPKNPSTDQTLTPSIQENSLLPNSNHYPPKPTYTVIETISMVITGYSSSVQETDDTPFLTAAGTQTRDGVVASNLLPFGTKIRIPQYFGSKVFVVEDRMNERVGDLTIDVWFPSSYQARLFGVKYTYIETIR